VRKREVEFRPYTRERLVSQDVEVFSVDEDDEEPVARSAGLDLDDDDGMHEVSDDEEPEIDFGDEAGMDLGDDDDDE
jgi:hypothetical protein